MLFRAERSAAEESKAVAIATLPPRSPVPPSSVIPSRAQPSPHMSFRAERSAAEESKAVAIATLPPRSPFSPFCHSEQSAAQPRNPKRLPLPHCRPVVPSPPSVIPSRAQPSPHMSFRAERSPLLTCHSERSAAQPRNPKRLPLPHCRLADPSPLLLSFRAERSPLLTCHSERSPAQPRNPKRLPLPHCRLADPSPFASFVPLVDSLRLAPALFLDVLTSAPLKLHDVHGPLAQFGRATDS